MPSTSELCKMFWQSHCLVFSHCSEQCQGTERLNDTPLLNCEPIKSRYLVGILENLSHAKEERTMRDLVHHFPLSLAVLPLMFFLQRIRHDLIVGMRNCAQVNEELLFSWYNQSDHPIEKNLSIYGSVQHSVLQKNISELNHEVWYTPHGLDLVRDGNASPKSPAASAPWEQELIIWYWKVRRL